METPFESFVASPPFRFLIGPDRKPIYVHTDLVAQHSKPLATLVNGAMAESKKQSAELEDVAEKTFVRFAQFMYTGDYDVPDPEILLAAEDIEVGSRRSGDETTAEEGRKWVFGNPKPRIAEPEDVVNVAEPIPASEENNSWGLLESVRKGKKDKKKKSVANEWREEIPAPEPPLSFSSDAFVQRPSKQKQVWSKFTAGAEVRVIPSWEPRENAEACEDYTTIFLAHAQLYVFSDKYSIEPLRDVALQKLRLSLARFRLFSERIQDIVELVRYTYRHTVDHDIGFDKLRSLVMDYVVCHAEKFIDNADFQETLQEDGVMGKDLMMKIVKRLD